MSRQHILQQQAVQVLPGLDLVLLRAVLVLQQEVLPEAVLVLRSRQREVRAEGRGRWDVLDVETGKDGYLLRYDEHCDQEESDVNAAHYLGVFQQSNAAYDSLDLILSTAGQTRTGFHLQSHLNLGCVALSFVSLPAAVTGGANLKVSEVSVVHKQMFLGVEDDDVVRGERHDEEEHFQLKAQTEEGSTCDK